MDDPTIIKNAVAGAPPMGAPPGAPQGPPPGLPPLGPPGGMPPQGQGMPAMGGEEEGGNQLTTMDRRLRVLEERIANLRRRAQSAEQNTLKTQKTIQKENKTTLDELRDLRNDLHDVRQKFRILVAELKGYATKEEVKVLEKYVNMWEPVTFVTRNEVDRQIRESVEQRFADLNVRMQQEKFIEAEVARRLAQMKAQGQLK